MPKSTLASALSALAVFAAASLTGCSGEATSSPSQQLPAVPSVVVSATASAGSANGLSTTATLPAWATGRGDPPNLDCGGGPTKVEPADTTSDAAQPSPEAALGSWPPAELLVQQRITKRTFYPLNPDEHSATSDGYLNQIVVAAWTDEAGKARIRAEITRTPKGQWVVDLLSRCVDAA